MAADIGVIPSIAAYAPRLIELRRRIHHHPELAYEESQTSRLIAETLTNWNIPVHVGVGRTGVVGVIRNGTSDRAIGLRADMDALPMKEQNEFAHASSYVGRMHACGHDGHVSMLLAGAHELAQRKSFDGTVYLIFQPAEEGGGGAREMIRDGLFERFPMDAIFGMHNWPGLPAGRFAVKPGPVFASSNAFRISIRGKGTHAAMPHGGVDPLPIACHLVQAFQTIITRNKRPLDTGLISVTMIKAGDAVNVIPDSCELQGTVRTFDVAVLDMIEQRMRETSDGICKAFGANCEFDFVRRYPPTVNHVKEAAFVQGMLRRFAGEVCVQEFEPTMGAEDFGFYLLEKPGCYFVIGNGDGQHRASGHGSGSCTLHSPSYDFNDDLIALGGSMWVKLVDAWFQDAHCTLR